MASTLNCNCDSFRYSGVGKIRSLTEVTITATLDDADTGPGEFDEGQLTLALDGIDTGIKLNGFPSGQTVTQTITGVPANAGKIRDHLKADGKLQVTIIDHTPDDGNTIFVPGTFDTTLTIKGRRLR